MYQGQGLIITSTMRGVLWQVNHVEIYDLDLDFLVISLETVLNLEIAWLQRVGTLNEKKCEKRSTKCTHLPSEISMI
jgi:hypothetical protein